MRKNFKSYIKFKTPQKVYDVIDVNEFQLMLNEADNERDKLILKVLFGTGIRVAEFCNLQFENLDFRTSSGTVVGKGNKERTISINSQLLNDIYRF